ncbi:MAG: hypothetical protein Q7W13_13990 [Bacteroidia bacterium]|nr:hypothetical protein [Bacteroidia bacterium]
MYIILNSEAEANAINSRINFDISPTWIDGVTNNYCTPIKHPELNKWAVIIDPAYIEYFTANEITQSVELTADWSPISTL